MRATATLFLVFLIASVPAGCGDKTSVAERASIVAENCHVIDGDTLHCGSLKILLLGIDAAEMPGHCDVGRDCAPGDAFEQRAELIRLARGSLKIFPKDDGGYGRIAALVKNAAGDDLSCAMLAAGVTYKSRWDRDLSVAGICPELALAHVG